MSVAEYKCSNCGGAVAFDGKAQSLVCSNCDSKYDVAAFEAFKEAIDRETGSVGSGDAGGRATWGAGGRATWDWDSLETEGVETGVCPSCGAELFGCRNAVAVVCPYCGNAEVAVKRLSGMLKPDCVIPFKLVKKNAVAALKRFCRDKYLLPGDYLEEKRVNGMQGVYVPFWLFDANAGGRAFEKIPVDGSIKMDDDYMDAIEPYYYGGLKEFDPAYLAGYIAEKYDVSAQECGRRAVRRIRGSFEESAGNHSGVGVKITKERYALLPVWVFNAKYGGVNHRFMVNGQTGSLAGKLPTDSGKVKKFTALLTGAYGALFTAIALVTMRPSVVKWLLGGDEFGSDALIKLLVNPAGHVLNFAMNFKILVIAGLWGAAYVLASRIIKGWKAKMDTIGLKGEAYNYAVRR